MYWRVGLEVLHYLSATQQSQLKTLHCFEPPMVPAGAEGNGQDQSQKLILDYPVAAPQNPVDHNPEQDNQSPRKVEMVGEKITVHALSVTEESQSRQFYLVDGITFVGESVTVLDLDDIRHKGEQLFNLWSPVNVYWGCVPIRDNAHLGRIPDRAVLTVTDRTL